MLNPQALQLRVGVDVGSQCHSVAIGLTDGRGRRYPQVNSDPLRRFFGILPQHE